jgi:hypothetical protein
VHETVDTAMSPIGQVPTHAPLLPPPLPPLPLPLPPLDEALGEVRLPNVTPAGLPAPATRVHGAPPAFRMLSTGSTPGSAHESGEMIESTGLSTSRSKPSR